MIQKNAGRDFYYYSANVEAIQQKGQICISNNYINFWLEKKKSKGEDLDLVGVLFFTDQSGRVE